MRALEKRNVPAVQSVERIISWRRNPMLWIGDAVKGFIFPLRRRSVSTDNHA